ncbi:uncharacterized protein E0L32_000403 [Thyridium curvatum]|uniref:Cytochrome P450 n=1 Tax=Thyridium curvatum TaxID=1093900 RepID=A0A507B9D7_9PEZI|nr:uncharacterized protein E0L32_000403 [Thyridium curvatum]TPX14009.1 hypothetical protein E0L32_000403 [Thyridium curvatum]
MAFLVLWTIAFIGLIGYLTRRYVLAAKKRLPPGPKPLPVVGNIRDVPPPGVPEFQYWLNHKDLYGPISSVTSLGTTLVIIHDKAVAHDLLDRSSSITSGRPSMTFANKMCGYESIVVCQGYTSTFRRYRKLLHQELGTRKLAAQLQDAFEIEVNRQLVKMLEDPDRWLEHFKTSAGATTLKLTYDYTIKRDEPDPLVELVDRMMTEFSLAAAPFTWAVDFIPALQYLPEWFPGTSFKKTARKWKSSIHTVADTPYRSVQRQMESGKTPSSYVSRLIESCKPEDGGPLDIEDERAIMWSAASLYGAAADTTIISLTAFMLAMVLFPEVQLKAQREIDSVVGTRRLPGFEDREGLPYIDALVKETIRWWPVAPMGFPHTVGKEISYNGLCIPQGALLLPAVWWFLHDPEVYLDPGTFDPGRFLAPRNEPDPSSEAFGYGRRICPGRFLADSNLYLNIVQTLAIFNIEKAINEHGTELKYTVAPRPGILSYPTDFKIRVTPRSDEHVKLVEALKKKQSSG